MKTFDEFLHERDPLLYETINVKDLAKAANVGISSLGTYGKEAVKTGARRGLKLARSAAKDFDHLSADDVRKGHTRLGRLLSGFTKTALTPAAVASGAVDPFVLWKAYKRGKEVAKS